MKRLLAFLLLLTPLVSHAAITVVQSTNHTNFSVTTHSVTLVSTPTVGNYVIVGMAFRGWQNGYAVSSVVDNQSGNTFSSVTNLSTGVSGQSAGAIYIAQITAATGTYTVTATTSGGVNDVMWAVEVSGISGATDIASGAASTLAITAQSVTQTAPNANASDLVLALFAGGTYSTGLSMGMSDPPATGYTSLGVATGTGAYGGAADAGYKILSSVETSAASWTTTTATDGVALIVSFVGASGGTGGSVGKIAQFSQFLIPQWQTVTTSTALNYTTPTLLCDATAGALTITLPTAVNSFTTYRVKKIDSSAHNCTVATTNTQTVDGAATVTLSTQYQSVSVFSDNANWWKQ